MKKEKSFTLIELLVVISIIGLLSSIVLVSVNSVRLKARDAVIMKELEQLRVVAAFDHRCAEGEWFGTPAYLQGHVPNCIDADVDQRIVQLDMKIRENQGNIECTDTDAYIAGIQIQQDAPYISQTEQKITEWVAWARLAGGGCWCVDGRGRSMRVEGVPTFVPHPRECGVYPSGEMRVCL